MTLPEHPERYNLAGTAAGDTETFIAELAALVGQARAASFVSRWQRITVRFGAVGAVYKVRAAVSMLAHGMGRADARAALMERYGVSRRTAYRILQAALEDRRE